MRELDELCTLHIRPLLGMFPDPQAMQLVVLRRSRLQQVSYFLVIYLHVAE
jgi:hypothetical protein